MGFIGPAFEEAIKGLVIFGIAIGFVVGAAVFVVGPWLWQIVKPWIHSITA